MKTQSLALIVATLITGCAVPGERAANDGACPQGETCSPDTPDGLAFRGPTLFDGFGGGPRPIAAGGTQRITVEDGAQSEVTLDAFDAATTGILAIGDVAPPEVTVLATDAGEGYLRILEPGTDDLYDRILLQAEVVKEVDMFPAASIWVDPEVAPDGWAVFAGEEVSIGIRLHGATGRLVDQSLTIDVAGAAVAAQETPKWDEAVVVPDASGEVAVTIKLGDGSSHEWAYPIAAKVEKISRIVTGLSPEDGTSVPPGEARFFCFRATEGDLAIAGVPWTFESGEDVELDPMGSCVSVKTNIAGPHVLNVKAGDQELTLDFEAVAGAGQKVMKPGARPTSAPTSATPGERLLQLTASPR